MFSSCIESLADKEALSWLDRMGMAATLHVDS